MKALTMYVTKRSPSDKKYVIENVTDYEGNVKPQRIGRLVNPFGEIKPGMIAEFAYLDENPKCLVTSMVLEKIYKDNLLIIKTMNSIYTLREYHDKD